MTTEMSEVDAQTHPIIPGFHPDPTICRVGADHYIAHSTFEYSPGVPLWHSTDLATWVLVGHALDGDPLFPAGRARAGGGIYAPTLRHHDGRFWMITTDVSGGGGQLLTSAPAIEGPWGPSIVIDGIAGIDPDLAWDDDGTALVTFSSNDPEAPGIAQVRVDLERGALLDAPRTVSRGSGLAYPEGPHLFRRGEWWYLLYAEGGTERGHCVSIARAVRPTGPFELFDGNPILTRRSTDFEVQNTGHADLVELAEGEWAMVYLGVRPRGSTPQFHVNGRETFLAGVEWRGGWPHVVLDRYSFTPRSTAFIDRFDTATLDPRWVSPAAAPAEIATALPGGGVQIAAIATTNGAPAMLAARAVDPHWRFEADTDASQPAAVRVRMDDRHWCELRIDNGRAELHVHIGSLRDVTVDSCAAAGAVTLRIDAAEATSGGPDDLVFTVRDAAGERELGRIDGRYLSTEVAGGFVGRTIGLRALERSARFAEVRYQPIPASEGL